LLKISLASLPCLSMLPLLKHAYSTRLKSSKHSKMSATVTFGRWFVAFLYLVSAWVIQEGGKLTIRVFIKNKHRPNKAQECGPFT
jgi:hypothetical protein